MKRVLIPLLAAASVLALVGVLFWLAASGDDPNDRASFGSGDTATGSDGATGGGVPGDAGSVEPADPGTVTAGDPDVPDEPAASDPTPSGPLAVPADSYYQYDARRLALSYYIGVPECYGTIDQPVVEETPRTVTVTLTRVPPDDVGDIACIEIALFESVDIELSAPLGDRRVLDGSFEPPVKVQESPRPPEDSR